MKKSGATIDILFTLVLFCAYAASVLLCLMTGAQMYRETVDDVDQRYAERTSLAYIASKVQASNSAGAVYLIEFGDGDALVLEQERDAEGFLFYTVIYSFYGDLCEIYDYTRSQVSAREVYDGQDAKLWSRKENVIVPDAYITFSLADDGKLLQVSSGEQAGLPHKIYLNLIGSGVAK